MGRRNNNPKRSLKGKPGKLRKIAKKLGIPFRVKKPNNEEWPCGVPSGSYGTEEGY